MSPSVVFTPEAEDQLAELYRYIAGRGLELQLRVFWGIGLPQGLARTEGVTSDTQPRLAAC